MNSQKDIHNKEADLHFMNIEKFSSFDKPLRLTPYLSCYIANLKNCLNKERINLGKQITTEEKSFAEGLWIIYEQTDIFSSKQYEQLKSDLGFIVDRIVRCKERFGNTFLSFETKHCA